MNARPTYRLRFFFDMGSGICLWSGNEAAGQRYDYPVEPRTLPLQETTIREMERLITWYDQWMDWDHAPQPHPSWDEAAFTAAARPLLDKLRRELGPNYEVVDEACSRKPADPEEPRRGWRWRIWPWLKTRWALRPRGWRP
jgi:hypothetical protein